MGTLICIIIGIFNGACGVAYKIGSVGKVDVAQCAAAVTAFGMLVFGVMAGCAQWQTISLRITLGGLLLGAAQYLGMRMLRSALSLGPLSPVWCAQSLNFVLVIIYSALCLNEHLSAWQYGALLAAIGAIVAASFESGGGTRVNSRSHVLLYGLLLIGILASASILSIGMKFGTIYCEPGQNVPVMARSGYLLMFFVNLFQCLCCVAELTCGRKWVFNRQAAISGGMVSLCGILGCILTVVMVAKVSAVVLFVMANATSILVASLISVACFQERKSPAWACTIGLSLLAIALNH